MYNVTRPLIAYLSFIIEVHFWLFHIVVAAKSCTQIFLLFSRENHDYAGSCGRERMRMIHLQPKKHSQARQKKKVKEREKILLKTLLNSSRKQRKANKRAKNSIFLIFNVSRAGYPCFVVVLPKPFRACLFFLFFRSSPPDSDSDSNDWVSKMIYDSLCVELSSLQRESTRIRRRRNAMRRERAPSDEIQIAECQSHRG